MTHRLPVYLSEEEKEALQSLADADRRSMSEFIAKLVREEALRKGIIVRQRRIGVG